MNIDYEAKMRIYLASPYSHDDPKIRHKRFKDVAIASAMLMEHGYVVYSPIVHSHVIAEYLDNALDHEFWLTQDASHIATCHQLEIFMLEGWKESFGVTWEIGFSNGLNIPVTHLEVEVVAEWADKKGIEHELRQ